MRNLFLLILSFPFALFAQNTKNMSVQINGFENTKGVCRVCLHSGEKTFPDDSKGAKCVVVQIEGQKAIATFTGLKAGKYALAAFHDANNNDQIDKNFFGIPKEGFAFSNDAMGTFGAPSFRQASLEMDGKSHLLPQMTLKYWGNKKK